MGMGMCVLEGRAIAGANPVLNKEQVDDSPEDRRSL